MHNGHNTKNILAILSNNRRQEIVLMSKYRLLKLYLGIEWHRIPYGLLSLYIGTNNRWAPTLWVFKNIANLSSKHGDFLFMCIYFASLDRYINTFWNNLVSRIALYNIILVSDRMKTIFFYTIAICTSIFNLPYKFSCSAFKPSLPYASVFYGLSSQNWIVQVF